MENTDKFTYSSTITIIFWIDKLRFLVGISISNSQKLTEWIFGEVEGYSRSGKHYEPIQQNSDLYNCHTTSGYKFIQVPIDYKPGDTGTYSGT